MILQPLYKTTACPSSSSLLRDAIALWNLLLWGVDSLHAGCLNIAPREICIRMICKRVLEQAKCPKYLSGLRNPLKLCAIGWEDIPWFTVIYLYMSVNTCACVSLVILLFPSHKHFLCPRTTSWAQSGLGLTRHSQSPALIVTATDCGQTVLQAFPRNKE